MEHATTHASGNARPSAAWREPTVFAALIVGAVAGWWTETLHLLAAPGATGPPEALRWIAVVSLAGRGAAWCAEAAFYVIWWRAWGRRLPFGRAAGWIVVYSTCASLASEFARTALERSDLAAWIAPLAGPGAMGLVRPPWSVFGDAGLLTALRIGLTGDAHARLLGIGRRAPILTCAGAWLATRAALLLLADLARGRSPWS